MNKITTITFLVLFFMLIETSLRAQENVYVSPDSTVRLEVKRENKTIVVALVYNPDDQLDKLIVERSLQSTGGFSQCRYLKTNNSSSEIITINFRDNYANYISEYFYRLKSISIDGVERVYPALRLPSLSATSTQ